ncbi:MAG: hypothetical protein V4629_11100 [Pseudomonadota bacterium]
MRGSLTLGWIILLSIMITSFWAVREVLAYEQQRWAKGIEETQLQAQVISFAHARIHSLLANPNCFEWIADELEDLLIMTSEPTCQNTSIQQGIYQQDSFEIVQTVLACQMLDKLVIGQPFRVQYTLSTHAINEDEPYMTYHRNIVVSHAASYKELAEICGAVS